MLLLDANPFDFGATAAGFRLWYTCRPAVSAWLTMERLHGRQPERTNRVRRDELRWREQSVGVLISRI